MLNPGGKMLGGPPKGDLWLVLVEAGENQPEPEARIDCYRCVTDS